MTELSTHPALVCENRRHRLSDGPGSVRGGAGSLRQGPCRWLAGLLSHRLLLAALGAVAAAGAADFTATADAQEAGPAPDRSSRELLIVHNEMRDERIETIGRGPVQLLFADQSSLSIAPGSDVVINEFLYDPQSQTGLLTVTLMAGLLRYVAGEIGRQRDVAFYTPTTVVSVRGGIAVIKAERDAYPARAEALFLSGDRMCVTANGQSQCTTLFATAITSEGDGPPAAPVPATAEKIQALFSDLQAARGGEPGDANARR